MVRGKGPILVVAADREFLRDDEGRWLCNIVAGCDGVATLQAAFPCETGCDAAVVKHEKLIDGKRREADEYERAVGIVRDEMQRAAEAGDPIYLTSAERLAIQLGHDNLKQLRADIKKLEAVRARVAGEHTHPVFACAKHEKTLQRHPSYEAALRALESATP